MYTIRGGFSGARKCTCVMILLHAPLGVPKLPVALPMKRLMTTWRQGITYKLGGSSCASRRFYRITSVSTCQSAARELGLDDQFVNGEDRTNSTIKVSGCAYKADLPSHISDGITRFSLANIMAQMGTTACAQRRPAMRVVAFGALTRWFTLASALWASPGKS